MTTTMSVANDTLQIGVWELGTDEKSKPTPGVTSVIPSSHVPDNAGVDSEPRTSKFATGGPMSTLSSLDRVPIGSLLDVRLRMRRVITLVLQREDEFYIAKYDELNEFGYGHSPIDAIQDFRRTLGELYWSLRDPQKSLGPDLASTWELLSAFIYEA